MMRQRFTAALMALLFSSLAHAQVFSSTPHAAIHDAGTLVSTIHVSGGPSSISSVSVVVKIRHGCDSDLDIALVHGNNYIRLSSANGQLGHDYQNTRFSDFAPTFISDAAPPFVGTFRPEGGMLIPFGASAALPDNAATSLMSFSGQISQGDWSLWIDDTADSIEGTLDSWSIEFNGAVDPSGPPLASGSPDPGVCFELADAGNMIESAQVCRGSGALTQIVGSLGQGDTDVYMIKVCDYSHFRATTVGGTYFDTRLFLFDASGNPVAYNDDEAGDTSQSTITNRFLTSGGNYYLAITASGRMPLDASGAPIWLDEPAVAERAPDGAGLRRRPASWIGEPRGGRYRISLTGVCYFRRPCAADFNNDGSVGTDQDVFDFFSCLRGDCCPTCSTTDIDGDGSAGTDADIFEFFRVLGAGC